MSDALTIFSKPFFDWTPEERAKLPELIETIFSSGVKILILGQKRCFLCGEELGVSSGQTKRISNNDARGLIVANLCDSCWKLALP